ncbi:MAG: SH3 domain-containing protein [Cypionkella sp.]
MIPLRKRLQLLAVSLGLVLATSVAASAFESARGYASTGLNLRAGPGTGYPVVSTVRNGDAVNVYGCTQGYVWCDIGWGGNRGWAYGNYVQMNHANRRQPVVSLGSILGIPIELFAIDSYWQQNYQQHSFYSSKHSYSGKDFNPRGHWKLKKHGKH